MTTLANIQPLLVSIIAAGAMWQGRQVIADNGLIDEVALLKIDGVAVIVSPVLQGDKISAVRGNACLDASIVARLMVNPTRNAAAGGAGIEAQAAVANIINTVLAWRSADKTEFFESDSTAFEITEIDNARWSYNIFFNKQAVNL